MFGWKAWASFVEEVAFETDREGREVNDFDRWGWGWARREAVPGERMGRDEPGFLE